MMQIIIYLMLTISIIIFSKLKHPLAIGLMLMINTLMISTLIGMSSQSFWFSYILTLIFMGGMLVMFIYVITLASNEMMKFSNKMFYIMAMFIIIMMIILFMNGENIMNMMMLNKMNNLETTSMKMNLYIKENQMITTKLYMFPTNLITLWLTYYLFLTLIAVVKITNFNLGPVRNLN